MQQVKSTSKLRKWLIRPLVVLSALFIVYFISSGLFENKKIETINKAMNPTLLLYEEMRTDVVSEIRGILLVSDENSYRTFKSSSKMEESLIDYVYGKSYKPDKFLGASKVEFLDVQYQFGDPLDVEYYVVVDTEKDGRSAIMRFLVTAKQGVIVDLIAV